MHSFSIDIDKLASSSIVRVDNKVTMLVYANSNPDTLAVFPLFIDCDVATTEEDIRIAYWETLKDARDSKTFPKTHFYEFTRADNSVEIHVISGEFYHFLDEYGSTRELLDTVVTENKSLKQKLIKSDSRGTLYFILMVVFIVTTMLLAKETFI